jgi:RNA polymerase sigma-70 factor (ECF subfamily)
MLSDEWPESDRSLPVLTGKELAAERRLVEASQKDSRRFAELYERYFNRVYAFALTRTGNRAAAEDVTAETFRRALQNLAKFEWRDVPFSAWLFRIAANAAADLSRRAPRQTSLNDLPDEQPQLWEARFIEVEERAQLFTLLKRLRKDQQRVIIMRFAQERSSREIAQAIGRSEAAVKALQFRALQNLRMWAEGG